MVVGGGWWSVAVGGGGAARRGRGSGLRFRVAVIGSGGCGDR